MRVKINLSANYVPVPIQNYTLMNAYINKCFGDNNDLHDKSGNYSISPIQGGRLMENRATLQFHDGAYFFISSIDPSVIDRFLKGMLKNLDFGFGMSFTGIEEVNERFFEGWNHFNTISPMLFRESKKDQPDRFVLFNEPGFESYVKERMVRKFKHLFPKYDFENEFDVAMKSSEGHKVKSILVKNRINKASQCSISIRCSKEMAQAIYDIGIGQSTNSGFGFICTAKYFPTLREISKKTELSEFA
jgi:CRISPR-associated endoribonuclease Cas6